MPTVIRAADHNLTAGSVAFNFDDMADRARQRLDSVRAEAARIIAQARQEALAQAQREAAAVRQRAEEEGRLAARTVIERFAEEKLATAMPALRQAIAEIGQAKQAWLAHWETAGIHVAAAIAGRVIRRELTRQPDIPLALVREALELAAGSTRVEIHLHPADHDILGGQVQAMLGEMAGTGEAQLIADPAISPGGCRVETRFGTIDQQFDAQLARIEEELGE